jgi:MFS transporter, DHA1 family, staphyloferrin A biosynthesis exporter
VKGVPRLERSLVDGEAQGRSPLGQVIETFRIPYFLPLWGSNGLQFCAWYAQLLVLQWLVMSLTDSRTLLGLVSFVQGGVIFLTSPLAGVAVDRFPRRHVLMTGRIGLAAVLAALAAGVASGQVVYAHLIVASVAIGALASLMQPATQTFVFDVVGRERAPSAVSLNSAITGLAQTLGPMAGGAALGAFGFVGACFGAAGALGLAALALLAVPVLARGEPAPGRNGWWSELREGLAWVSGNRPVLLALFACSMSIFNGALAAMRPVFARHVLDVGSVGYGTMAGMAGAGGLTAALAMSMLPRTRHPGLWIAGSMLGFSLLIVAYALAPSYPFVLAAEFGTGLCGQVWMVSTFTGLQMAVPETMRGRIVALVFMLATLAPVGSLVVGALADAVGDRPAMAVFGAIPALLLTALLVFGHGSLRRL